VLVDSVCFYLHGRFTDRHLRTLSLLIDSIIMSGKIVVADCYSRNEGVAGKFVSVIEQGVTYRDVKEAVVEWDLQDPSLKLVIIGYYGPIETEYKKGIIKRNIECRSSNHVAWEVYSDIHKLLSS